MFISEKNEEWKRKQQERKAKARKEREKLSKAIRAENAANKEARIAQRLVAEGFLMRAFSHSKMPSTPAKNFYSSKQWATVRYAALIRSNGACQCCGARASDGVKMHVDHIKPRSKFPELALELSNLQVLCELCNVAKSNIDTTAWPVIEQNKVQEEYDESHIFQVLRSF